MVGLIVFGILSLIIIYFSFLINLVLKSKGKKRIWSSIILVISILIPTWDIPYKSYRYNKLCDKNGGIFVYKETGLPKDFYFEKGEPVWKCFKKNGGESCRDKPATGKELDLTKIKERFTIKGSQENNVFPNDETVKFTTEVWDGNSQLGKLVYYIGGSGWFGQATNMNRRSGVICPQNTDNPHNQILYEIFYKLEE